MGEFLPQRFSEIEDPDSFFSTLGEEVADEIDELSLELAGDDRAGEDYLGKVGRLNAARQQARERVLGERVFLPAEPGSPLDESEPEPSGTGTWTTDWIPMTKDPNHPWWQDQDNYL